MLCHRKHSHRAFSRSHCYNFVSVISDDLHRKSEKDMTEEELKQKDIDRAYFHSHRDTNKDGVMDKVKKPFIFEMLCCQRHATMHSAGS